MLRYNVQAGQISASSYHIASQPPGRDVNGPVYWRMKLDKGKHNLQLASQRSAAWSASSSQLKVADVRGRRIFKRMERDSGLHQYTTYLVGK
jgi:hypothetical protein